MKLFTSGPWTCQQTGDRKRYVIGEGQSSWGTHVAEVYSDDIDREEAAANAKLIQSAPDLLDACSRALALLDNSSDEDKTEVREALAATMKKAGYFD